MWDVIGKSVAVLGILAAISAGCYGLYHWGASDAHHQAEQSARTVKQQSDARYEALRLQTIALHGMLAQRLGDTKADKLSVCVAPDGKLSNPSYSADCSTGKLVTFPITYNADGKPILGWPAAE